MTRSGGPTVGVLLSGGASSRMGRPKALLRDRKGRTFLDRLVRTLRDGGCEQVIVVAGRHVARIAQELPAGALLVRNVRWERGQLSSAAVGLRAALAFAPSGIVLHLIDQPLIEASDVARVIAALDSSELAIATCSGVQGHPLAMTVPIAERVSISRAATLRAALARSARRRVVVEGCSAGCVQGANTPAELRDLLRGT